jgi:hypothetical protein
MTTWQIIGLYLIVAGVALVAAEEIVKGMIRRLG